MKEIIIEESVGELIRERIFFSLSTGFVRTNHLNCARTRVMKLIKRNYEVQQRE